MMAEEQNLDEPTEETDVGDLLRQLLQEVREERNERRERDDRLEERIGSIESQLKTLKQEVTLIGEATAANGAQLGIMTKQCSERLKICRGGGKGDGLRRSGDSWPAEDSR